MESIRFELYETLAADHPMTVRQVFYALTTRGAIAKTEAEYKGTVCRLLAEMRRSGDIPYTWLADATRWMRKSETYSSAEQALKTTASTYRRALWDSTPERVEIWLEKEALAGVLVDVTDEWDVPLMVTRGYPSMSFLYSAAAAIASRAGQDQKTHIYYLGDRDPSGVDIDRAVRQGIGESIDSLERGSYDSSSIEEYETWDEARAGIPNFDRKIRRSLTTGLEEWEPKDRAQWNESAFADYATFTRVAITEEQIEAFDLPTRPTKKSDTRSRSFKGESVELDAMPSRQLRELATECIERHVNRHEIAALQKAEAEERRLLLQMAETFNGTAS